MSNEIKAKGTKFFVQMDDGSWLESEATSIAGLGSGESTEIDVTKLTSEAKEFLMGLKDEGLITVNVDYNPANLAHKRMESLRNNSERGKFRVVLPDVGNETWEFTANVKNAPFGDIAPDTVLQRAFGLRVSGSIDVT